MSSSHSAVRPFPLRTDSMILNASNGFSFLSNRYVIISSRHAITSLNGCPACTSDCALPAQTSVPCVSPEIITSSENDDGFVSSRTRRVIRVPNSGKPKAPFSFL